MVRVDRSHDLGGLFFGVVVAACGVVHGGTTDEVVVGGFPAANGFVCAPLRAGDHFRSTTGERFGDVLECVVVRRGAWIDQDDRQILAWCRVFTHRLREGCGHVAERGRSLIARGSGSTRSGCSRSGCSRSGRGRRNRRRSLASHQNLCCRCVSDVDRLGAGLRAGGCAVVATGVDLLGRQPRTPFAVRLLHPNSGVRGGQVFRRQRDHAERSFPRHFLHRRAEAIDDVGR